MIFAYLKRESDSSLKCSDLIVWGSFIRQIYSNAKTAQLKWKQTLISFIKGIYLLGSIQFDFTHKKTKTLKTFIFISMYYYFHSEKYMQCFFFLPYKKYSELYIFFK